MCNVSAISSKENKSRVRDCDKVWHFDNSSGSVTSCLSMIGGFTGQVVTMIYSWLIGCFLEEQMSTTLTSISRHLWWLLVTKVMSGWWRDCWRTKILMSTWRISVGWRPSTMPWGRVVLTALNYWRLTRELTGQSRTRSVWPATSMPASVGTWKLKKLYTELDQLKIEMSNLSK